VCQRFSYPIEQHLGDFMQPEAVAASYRRWASIYDLVFGRMLDAGRAQAGEFVNAHSRKVLEVGVGSGLSLPKYRPDLEVVGIDYSRDMLAVAAQKRAQQGLGHVALAQMDGGALAFADASFDTVVAAHVLSTVPDPGRVLAEMARVCQPGGHVIIINHFSADGGVLRIIERSLQPLQHQLGWRADFPIATALQNPHLAEVERRKLPPLGLMTWLLLRRK